MLRQDGKQHCPDGTLLLDRRKGPVGQWAAILVHCEQERGAAEMPRTKINDMLDLHDDHRVRSYHKGPDIAWMDTDWEPERECLRCETRGQVNGVRNAAPFMCCADPLVCPQAVGH